MDINDDLINQITKKIIQRLNLSKNNENISSVTLRALNIGRENSLTADTIKSLKNYLDLEQIVFPAKQINNSADYDLVIVSYLDLTSLVQLSLGFLEGPNLAVGLILETLLNGKTVYLVTEGLKWHQYKDKAPQALLSYYAGCEKIIKDFGIIFIQEADLNTAIDLFCQKNCHRAQTSELKRQSVKSDGEIEENNKIFLDKKVITEIDILQLSVSNLVISAKTIITPLAWDVLREKKINLFFE